MSKREPTDLVIAKGKKHLSKGEIAERRALEVTAESPKYVVAPKWLQGTMRGEFKALSRQLCDLGIFTKLDADTLARYCVAQAEWLQATAEVAAALHRHDSESAEVWGRIQDRYFKQARNCANDLGLTITSRCRLVVPQKPEEGQENPFLQLLSRERDRA